MIAGRHVIPHPGTTLRLLLLFLVGGRLAPADTFRLSVSLKRQLYDVTVTIDPQAPQVATFRDWRQGTGAACDAPFERLENPAFAKLLPAMKPNAFFVVAPRAPDLWRNEREYLLRPFSLLDPQREASVWPTVFVDDDLQVTRINFARYERALVGGALNQQGVIFGDKLSAEPGTSHSIHFEDDLLKLELIPVAAYLQNRLGQGRGRTAICSFGFRWEPEGVDTRRAGRPMLEVPLRILSVNDDSVEVTLEPHFRDLLVEALQLPDRPAPVILPPGVRAAPSFLTALQALLPDEEFGPPRLPLPTLTLPVSMLSFPQSPNAFEQYVFQLKGLGSPFEARDERAGEEHGTAYRSLAFHYFQKLAGWRPRPVTLAELLDQSQLVHPDRQRECALAFAQNIHPELRVRAQESP